MATQWEMIKQPLNTITAAITIIFTEGKEQNRSEQVLIYIYGLIKMLGNQLKSGLQEQSQRGKNVPSQRN